MKKEENAKKPFILSRILSKFFGSIDKTLSELKSSVIFLLIFSLLLNLLLEFSLRQSFNSLFSFIFSHPLSFILGIVIIFATFTFIYFFKRRTFVFFIVSILWFIIAYVNFYLMVLSQRPDPFNASDIGVFLSTLNIIQNGYLDAFGIVLIVLALILIISLLIYSYIKSSKCSGFFGKTAYIAIIAWAVMLSTVVIYINTAIEKNRHDSPLSTYREHGFAFCFLYSMIDSGIDMPENYTTEGFVAERDRVNNLAMKLDANHEEYFTSQMFDKNIMDSIYNSVAESYRTSPDYPYLNISKEQADKKIENLSARYSSFKVSHSSDSEHNKTNCKTFEKPNIIYLQLESFYDVNNIKGYNYSSEPTPVFSLLKEKLPGGYLSVPSLGAGTANTEFEIMTGLDKTYFSFTEYPYFTVLKDQTCESIAYNTKDYGYKTHVIHNHQGSFYDRNVVFSNLGFDTFTPVECFTDIPTNPRSWCKDSALIEPIISILESSDKQDLIYAISVQPHGKYPSAELYDQILDGSKPKIIVSGNETNPENPGFSYYVNQLNEVDTFIGEFLLELSLIEEPTIVVMYGDHLPSFSMEKYWQLKDGDYFQTDYVIWNNCGIDFSDAKDLKTYQLSSYIFSKIGIDSGDINKLNRLYLDNDLSNEKEQYAELLHIYEYAIFEDSTLRDPASPLKITTYEPTLDMTSAIFPQVKEVYTTTKGNTIIIGDNFNEYSKIVIDDDELATAYINRHVLMTNDSLKIGDHLSIKQVNGSNIFATSKQNILYNHSMMVDEEHSDEIMEYIKRYDSTESDTENKPIDDATEEFTTGQDEFDMIQSNRENSN